MKLICPKCKKPLTPKTSGPRFDGAGNCIIKCLRREKRTRCYRHGFKRCKCSDRYHLYCEGVLKSWAFNSCCDAGGYVENHRIRRILSDERNKLYFKIRLDNERDARKARTVEREKGKKYLAELKASSKVRDKKKK